MNHSGYEVGRKNIIHTHGKKNAEIYSQKGREEAISDLNKSDEFIVICKFRDGDGKSVIALSSPNTAMAFLDAIRSVSSEVTSCAKKLLLSIFGAGSKK